MIPTRQEAWNILNKYTHSQALLRHAISVEGVMRHFAAVVGEEENAELWAVAGLLHDVDYEMYPDEHCIKAQQLLKEEGVDDVLIRAVASHGYSIVCDVKPISQMEKVLFACDELTGLIAAAALMRPSRSVLDIELKSVKKKYKTPSFAAGVSRPIIEQGAQELGWTVDFLIEHTILGMRDVAEQIGLAGGEQQ